MTRFLYYNLRVYNPLSLKRAQVGMWLCTRILGDTIYQN